MYIYIYIYIISYIYIYIYIMYLGNMAVAYAAGAPWAVCFSGQITPSSHSKNSLSKIFAKGWVAQTSIFDR